MKGSPLARSPFSGPQVVYLHLLVPNLGFTQLPCARIRGPEERRIRSIGGPKLDRAGMSESTGARKRDKAVHPKPGGKDRGQVVAAKVMRAGALWAAGQRRERAGWCVSHRGPVVMLAFKVCESTAPRYDA